LSASFSILSVGVSSWPFVRPFLCVGKNHFKKTKQNTKTRTTYLQFHFIFQATKLLDQQAPLLSLNGDGFLAPSAMFSHTPVVFQELGVRYVENFEFLIECLDPIVSNRSQWQHTQLLFKVKVSFTSATIEHLGEMEANTDCQKNRKQTLTPNCSIRISNSKIDY